jgi:hypothetical protein
MAREDTELIRRRAREKALYRYGSALERGDFEVVADMLREAEHDAELERMILDLNQALQAEYEESAQDHAAEAVRQLVREHLPSGLDSSVEEVELPPLTVADVIARIKRDAAVRGPATHEVMAMAERLAAVQTPLPVTLSHSAVRRLLEGLGASASKSFLKLFRDTAIFLAMGREHGNARLAAARRERALRESKVHGTPYDQEAQP